MKPSDELKNFGPPKKQPTEFELREKKFLRDQLWLTLSMSIGICITVLSLIVFTVAMVRLIT